jgi:proteasome accessory factor C
LIVAARALADVPGLTARDALDRALGKIEDAVGTRPTERVRVTLDAQDEVLRLVQQAVARGRRVHLRYLVWSRDEMTERDVDPMRVLSRDGRWYLEGWCHRAEAVRLFRLDRIDWPGGLAVLDEPARPPASAVPRDITDGIYRRGPSDLRVVLELSAGARWVADYYPVESTDELAGGRLRVTLFAAETSWLHRLLLNLGGDARVLEPPTLAAEVHDLAGRALAGYGEGG